jgi:hypothetical protein
MFFIYIPYAIKSKKYIEIIAAFFKKVISYLDNVTLKRNI